MILTDFKAVHRRAAEPRLQALDQAQPFFPAGARILEKIPAFFRKNFDIRRLQPDCLHRRAELYPRQALAQEPGEVIRAAAGRGEPHPDCRRRRIVMQQAEGKRAHAGLARGEEAFHLVEQPPGGEQRAVGLQHRRRQSEPCRKMRRRDEEFARFGRPAAGPVDLVEQPRPETPGNAIARQPHQPADGADAEIGEQLRAIRERGR